jgi:hypothetical protein
MVDSKIVAAKINSEITKKVLSIQDQGKRAKLRGQLEAAKNRGDTAELIRLLHS